MAVMLVCPSFGQSTRQERRLINKGNELYKERKYVEAASTYEEALRVNANSAEARYNLGLAQVRQIANPADTTSANKAKLDQIRSNFNAVASQAKAKPGLAAKANFNLGNLEFKAGDYAKAVEHYKQSLRIDPTDEAARKNLRVAQKNLQKQQNQQNRDNNKDNQEKKQDKDKEKNDKQNQDQNKQQNQNKEDKQQPQQQNLSNQAASSILQAIDNKESQTRARVNRANKGEKSNGSGSNVRRW